MSQRYRAFLSYSHKDSSFARWLHRTLEHWKIHPGLVGSQTEAGTVPPKLRPIFRDRDDFAGGASLRDATLSALENSDFLVVLCSPNSANSIYVDAEIRAFKQLGRAHRIIPVIIDGEPGSAQQECFPPSVVREVDAAGQLTDTPVEPIAADARDSGDGRHRATAKIVAGLLGVTFDEIAKREEQAQRRRTRVIGGIAAAMGVLAILAGYLAWLADVRRVEAEQNFLAAKSAADSLLRDIAQEIKGVEGMPLDKTRLVLGRAEAIYDSLLETVGDDIDILASRAEALIGFATTYRNRDDGVEALRAARASEADFSRLIELQPKNPRWWTRRATVRATLLLTTRLNPDDKPDFDRAVFRALAKADLAQAEALGAIQGELQSAFGMVLLENGFAAAVEQDYATAEVAVEQAILRFQATTPDSVDETWLVGSSLHRTSFELLAMVHKAAGDNTAARLARYRQVARIELELQDKSQDPELRKALMKALISVAALSFDLDDPVAGERALRQAKRAEFALVAWDIQDPERLAEEARKAEQTGSDIGDVREYDNFRQVAEEWFLLAAGLRERLIQIGQKDAETWLGFLRVLQKIESMRFEEPEQQLKAYRASEAAMGEFLEQHPQEQLSAAHLAVRFGEIMARTDRPDEAIQAYSRAIKIFATAQNTRYLPHDPIERKGFAQMRIAWILGMQGRMDEAFEAAVAARDIYESGIDQYPELREALVVATSQIAPHDTDPKTHWRRILQVLDSEGALLSEREQKIRDQAKQALQ